jgi:hypothetical protein
VFAASKGDLTVSASDVDGPEVDPAADGQEPNRPDIWCLNLARLPEFKSEPQFAAARRFRLFRRVPDPRLTDIGPALTGALKQERDALVPLGWLLELVGAAHKADLLDDSANQRVIAAAECVLREAPVVRRLAEMRTNEVFHVSILDDTRDLADVVSVYARINTSGRPVEAEERAFAALVAACTDANEALRRFFVAVHPERMKEPSGGLVRDKLEQRERENKFGFKLFMRVFTIAFAYHSDRVRSTDLAFDAINADVLDKAAERLQAILDITVEVLTRLANVIRAGSLHCDDLRFLPDTSSLWPLIQLMVTFPILLAADPTKLEPIALSLVLADLPRRETLEIVKRVSQASSARAALELVKQRTGTDRIKRKIREGVEEQSLMGRYTLVLYWLLRSRGARDFTYKQPGLASLTPPELSLASGVDAQKQHIVPYDDLKRIFGLDGARLTRHPANDIGNITYISARENTFVGGLGSKPLRLDLEPEENLNSHLLDDPYVLAQFSATVRNADAGNLKQARTSYARFVKRRSGHVQNALVAWLDEARVHWPTGLAQGRPAPRLVKSKNIEVIFDFNFPEPVSERLVGLANRAGLTPARSDGRVSIPVRSKGSRAVAVRLDLLPNSQELGLKLSDKRLRLAFRRAFPSLADKATFGANGKVTCTHEQEMVAVLDWVARRQLKP